MYNRNRDAIVRETALTVLPNKSEIGDRGRTADKVSVILGDLFFIQNLLKWLI